MSTLRNRATLAAAAAAVLFFFWFAGDGLRAYFTPDDMMNLYRAWESPLREDRLAGALFYNAAWRAFGFEPFGYRVVCYLLLAGNLALLYGFALRLARSRFVAALACLLGAYHAHLADLYYSTGTVYDLLCYACWFGAFVWYASIRERGRTPDARSLALLLALYGASLQAKEMAVTLPAFVALYELLYYGREKGWRRWSFLLATIPLTAAFVAWKFGGRERMTENPAYAMTFTVETFAHNWRHFLNDLFYGAVNCKPAVLAWFWGLSLALAALLRRREMIFGWALFFFGSLPVMFLPERGLYVLYVTLPGFYLYVAALLEAAAPRRMPYREAALAAAVAAALGAAHRHEKPLGKQWVAEAFDSIRVLRQQLARYPDMPKGASVLFTEDPYPADDYIVTFIFRLHYHDRELRVDRIKQTRRIQPRESYRYIFAMRDGRLTEEKP